MKTFTSKDKSKNYYMQYYDKLIACFDNKLNFMKWRSNYWKMLDKKLSLMRPSNSRTPFSFGCVQRRAPAIAHPKRLGLADYTLDLLFCVCPQVREPFAGLEQIFILVDICSNTTGFKHVLKRKRYRDWKTSSLWLSQVAVGSRIFPIA